VWRRLELRIIAAIEDLPVIVSILAHLKPTHPGAAALTCAAVGFVPSGLILYP